MKKNLNQLLDKENLEKSDLNNTRIKKLVVDEKNTQMNNSKLDKIKDERE